MSAGAVLFGVADYVPALMEYVQAYGIDLQFGRTLVAVDGPARIATFRHTGADGTVHDEQLPFDLLHVVPPQSAPDFVRSSPLADAAGWIDVDRPRCATSASATSSAWATPATAQRQDRGGGAQAGAGGGAQRAVQPRR
jgi:hypothetical protein